MCGISKTNTYEHKIKKSIYKRFQNLSDEKELINSTITEDLKIEITNGNNGPNAKNIKFGEVLCNNCNNQVSQPFDLAYDKLAEYIDSHYRDFYIGSVFNLSEIFDNDELNDLYRYFIKYIAC